MSLWRCCCCCCCCCFLKSSSSPRGASSSTPSSVPSTSPTSLTSWIPSSVSFLTGPSDVSSSNPNHTFSSLAKNTNYGRVLKKRMRFTLYLQRGGIKELLHDRIVISSAKHGFVTLELGRESSSNTIVPVCEQFQGNVTELITKKELICTFKELVEKADECWRKMGSYDMFDRNCQDFCNHFLDSVNAEMYTTTAGNVKQLVNLLPAVEFSS